MADKSIVLKIRRQGTPNEKPCWEEFELPWQPGMNIISSLMEIARNPVTRSGKPTTPITYDSNCLEEICGSCAMLIEPGLLCDTELPCDARLLLKLWRRMTPENPRPFVVPVMSTS